MKLVKIKGEGEKTLSPEGQIQVPQTEKAAAGAVLTSPR